MSRPPVRDDEALQRAHERRIRLLERRLASGGGGGGGGGGAVFEAGLVMAWSGTPATVPPGWVLCDGRALSRTQYPALYGRIGTTYGAGDGSTTFNVPNGKGRFVVGQDGAQVEFDTVGETGGAKTHRHDFRFGLFDRNWQPAGSYAGMEGTTQPNDNDKMGAYRYSTGKFQGASQGSPGTSASALANNSAPAAGSAVNSNLNRMQSTGDTDVPTGTTGLPPYLVQNWIISTGAGSSNPTGAVVPVQLWQEFTLAKPGGLRPLLGGAVVWDGPVTGTLGATLSADKGVITLPAAGTYRILTHLGLAANNGTGTSAAIYVSGSVLPKSQTYGNSGAAGVFVPTVEVFLTTTGPTTFTQGATAPLGMYDWTWMRIEKVEPFQPSTAYQVFEGTTAQRNAIFPVPTTPVEQASLANRQIVWFNTDYGWWEQYFAQTGLAGLTVPGLVPDANAPAGWYPIRGGGPRALLFSAGGQSLGPGAAFTNWVQFGTSSTTGYDLVSWKNTPGNANDGTSMIHHAANNAAVQVFLAGRYRVYVGIQVQSGTGTAVASLRTLATSSATQRFRQKPIPLISGFGQIFDFTFDDIVLLRSGFAFWQNDAGGPLSYGAGPEDHFTVEYLGPPLSNTA